jgi:hypothetical protein
MREYGIGVVVLVAAALVGCAAEPHAAEHADGSVALRLVTIGGVELTEVDYDLARQSGEEVTSGAIPVPDDGTNASLAVNGMRSDDYRLSFSATGSFQGVPVACTSAPTLFHLAPGQHLTLPTITLSCRVTTKVDTTGSASADVSITTSTIEVNGIVEPFSYGPRSVSAKPVGTSCVFPPVAFAVANRDTSIHYAWSVTPDGSFSMNATNTTGTYQCVSGGDKTVTVTATSGGTSSSESVTISCDDTACGDRVGACLNCLHANQFEGQVQATYCDSDPTCLSTEACMIEGACISPEPASCYCGTADTTTCSAAAFIPTGPCAGPIRASVADNLSNADVLSVLGDFGYSAGAASGILAYVPARAPECAAICTPGPPPVCGNGVVELGEQCDENSARCTNCVVTPVCGDGIVDSGEACDDSTPRCVHCVITPVCGDGIVDAGEQCDETSPRCQHCVIVPVCGDGVVDAPEECDAPTLPTQTCDANCQSIPGDDPCAACIRASTLGSLQETYCDPLSSCRRVEQCFVTTLCFNPLPAACYCGITDVAACSQADFVPTGACAAKIRAGMPGLTSNADIVNSLFDATYPSGAAFSIFENVHSRRPLCALECNFP